MLKRRCLCFVFLCFYSWISQHSHLSCQRRQLSRWTDKARAANRRVCVLGFVKLCSYRLRRVETTFPRFRTQCSTQRYGICESTNAVSIACLCSFLPSKSIGDNWLADDCFCFDVWYTLFLNSDRPHSLLFSDRCCCLLLPDPRPPVICRTALRLYEVRSVQLIGCVRMLEYL